MGSSRSPLCADRRQNIDDFLASLSPYEFLYVRRQILHHIKPTGFKSLSDLPPEVLDVVAAHLPLNTLVSCLSVSHSWNRSWTRIFPALCRRVFPGLLENDEAPAQDRAARFIKAVRASWERKRGPHFMRLLELDHTAESFSEYCTRIRRQPVTADWPRLVSVCYFDGVVASQRDRSYFQLHSLRDNGSERIPLGEKVLRGVGIRLQLVTSDLVVFMEMYPSVRRKLHLWHRIHRQWKVSSLPAACVTLWGSGCTVVAVIDAFQIITWSWGGTAKSVRLDLQLTRGLRVNNLGVDVGVLFHPTKSSVFFVGFALTDTDVIPKLSQILLLKVIDGVPSERFQYRLNEKYSLLAYFQKTNAYGQHAVACDWQRDDRGDSVEFLIYYFDVLNARFTTATFNRRTSSTEEWGDLHEADNSGSSSSAADSHTQPPETVHESDSAESILSAENASHFHGDMRRVFTLWDDELVLRRALEVVPQASPCPRFEFSSLCRLDANRPSWTHQVRMNGPFILMAYTPCASVFLDDEFLIAEAVDGPLLVCALKPADGMLELPGMSLEKASEIYENTDEHW